MTRKSVKFPSGLRRGPWKTSLTKRECDDKTAPISILVSAACAKRWSSLKSKFHFRSDSELVEYLLTLGEAQPNPSTSPDHASDEGWCTSNLTGRKKRGPSLRAVLRRSTRNTGSKSDFLSESIESEDIQTEDSCLSVDDTDRSIKFSVSNSRSTKFSDYNELLSKKRYHAASGPKRASNSDKEKEAKANQLDVELALLVESVALKPQERTETELYEFRDDQQSENLSSHSLHSPENSNNIAKASHKRWKSYHKDKRKWKQSYAAVMPDDEKEEVQQTRTREEPSNCKSEKERKIFKALKKNRILTAYLDSQNKIAASTPKDSNCPNKEDMDTPVKEEDEKPDMLEPSPSCHKNSDKADDECSISDDQEGGPGLQVPEKGEDVSSGKENQSKTLTSEPVFIEVGERVKLKRRKKKLLQDSEESSLNSKEDDSISVSGGNTTDLEPQHRKQKRNWKKSIISYELEEMELKKKKRTTVDPTSNSSYIPPYNIVNQLEPASTDNPCELEPSQDELLQVENAVDVSQSGILELQESDDSKSKNCPLCNTRHHQQSCPVHSPHHVVGDAITFEHWQLQCQVQVRCSVIEAPKPKSGRLRRAISGSPVTTDVEKKNRDSASGKSDGENSRYFAEESMPVGLGLKVINEDHGRSVIAQTPIAQYTLFGPLVGPRVHEKDISDESDMRHIWEVLDGKQAIYLNTEDPQKSNWLRFMRPAPEREERNITLMVQNKQLYFVSIMDIPKGNELLYWADDHITLWSKKKILKSSCGGCNMRFAHPLYYRTHCAVFHDPSHSLTIRKYHCKVCGEAVMGKENIMKHAADLHEGRGAYQCQYCLKFFLRLNYLEMHRTYGCSSNPHRTRPLCDFCGRYFCQPQKLKVHIKRMHSDMNEVLREFQCKSCLKILGSRAALQRHFKEVHHRDVVVTSNCDRCGKSFQNRSNLKIHMLTHSGVKPFRCQQEGCSAAFTTKQCLQFHYKKAHGLSEDSLPRIERSIAYTFDAYAGEAVGSSNKSADQMKKPQRVFRKGRKSSAKSQRNRNHHIQLDESGSRQEPDEPSSSLHHETGTFETSVLSECSEPLQLNNVVEQHSYSADDDPTTVTEPLLSQKYIESNDNTHENSLPPPEIISLSYGQDEKQLSNDKTLTQLRTVTLRHHPEETYHSQHVTPMMSCHSPTQSPLSPQGTSPNQELRSIISLESKGHKKWLGEVIEVAEEAAAAAMRLSPRLSPRMKRDLYDFDEHKVKSKLQYVDNSIRQDLQIEVPIGRSKATSTLAPFHPPESASMLVEAALDAAERDICCPSLASKTSPNISSNSPEPLHLPHPSYCGARSPSCGDLSSPSYYVSDPTSVPTPDHSLSHYPLSHSPSSHPHIHPLDTYSINPEHMSPPRLYNVHHHQQHQHHLLPPGPPSSDDEGAMDSDCNARGECAQNLSLNVKEKTSIHSDISSMYNVSAQHSESSGRSSVYQDHVPLPQQNDLNFSGAMVVSSPRYHLYDLSPDRQRSDISVTDLTICSNRSSSHDYSSYNEEIGGSVDLTLPRSHSTSDGHIILANSPPNYNSNHVPPSLAQHGHPGPAHQYGTPHSMPSYSSQSAAYQNSPLQRSHISSSSNSPSASPSPGPAHYHSYSPYY